ncbi:phage head-tail connector protein [Chitinophaga pinensis]|uniref:Phage gp6-like head-tail connector protein n=1 Tax=Chitinophaga pinensis (strain ATCC 43595 / DSM 2588 / LMG 13176 / NBRC 15968 / NCIMB 11800 / UQM 2034) TaxID=485918 RepID=A0A979GVV5_CHIPD|nr:phage head-tail connector protein [Chitinophaga pinensis]ACU61356.1 hypothetical protein Cpin_3894 [Chitinophaga pinensis DSM 2588]
MCSNKLLDKKPLSVPDQEPVDLESVKEFMNVDFDEKNNTISSLIIAARTLLEDKYDIGIVKKRLQVVVDNSCGGIELPGFPVSNISAVDKDGAVVDLNTIGGDVVYVESPCSCYLKISYDSGYEIADVPEVYKTAIKEQVTWMFSNLNDVEVAKTIAPLAEVNLLPYRRNGFGVFL